MDSIFFKTIFFLFFFFSLNVKNTSVQQRQTRRAGGRAACRGVHWLLPLCNLIVLNLKRTGLPLAVTQALQSHWLQRFDLQLGSPIAPVKQDRHGNRTEDNKHTDEFQGLKRPTHMANSAWEGGGWGRS